jgi:hypothetical protein
MIYAVLQTNGKRTAQLSITHIVRTGRSEVTPSNFR